MKRPRGAAAQREEHFMYQNEIHDGSRSVFNIPRVFTAADYTNLAFL